MSVDPIGVAAAVASPELENVLPENQRDREADRQIQECLSSTTLLNKEIHYSYDHRSWPIRVIYNPEGHILIAKGDPRLFKVHFALISKEEIPQTLQDHINALIKSQLGSDKKGFWNSGMINGKSIFELYENLKSREFPKFNVGTFALDVDQKIRECFQSKVFIKTTFDYPFEGKNHQICVINNPEKLSLLGKGLNKLLNWSFVMVSSEHVPYPLRDHLESLAPREQKEDKDYVIDLSHFQKESSLQSLQPVEVNIDGALNAQFDAQIKEIFRSKELVNKVFYYRIKGEDYFIRIIHNPNAIKLRVTREINELFYKGLVTLPLSCRYNIFTHQKAPKELIDHLIKLAAPTWLGWITSFQIHNGENVRPPSRYWDSMMTYFDFFSSLPATS